MLEARSNVPSTNYEQPLHGIERDAFATCSWLMSTQRPDVVISTVSPRPDFKLTFLPWAATLVVPEVPR
jgi:hypothetical protein